MAPEIVEVNFNLDDGDYGIFIRDLRGKLADHPLQPKYILDHPWLVNHPLLPLQVHPQQPARWMHINLVVQDKNTGVDMRTTIAVRDDNVYLIGFRNRKGKWYEFGTKETNVRFIQGSTFLGCDVSYHDLVGGSIEQLKVGKYPAIGAVRKLSEYEEDGPADDATRQNLARMCVMICEAARMMPHYNTVNNGWNDAGGKISAKDAEYTKNWRSMSRELLSTREPSQQREDLLAVVHLLLNSPDDKRKTPKQSARRAGGSRRQGPDSSNPPSSRPPASGSGGGGTQEQKGGKSVRTKPLVEVFSVEAKLGDNGSIVVFDGKRGQIIFNYKHESRDSYYDGNYVAPTGPYKAISADGCFAIQVCDITDESSIVIGEMLCDCYADDVQYDTVLTGDIISTGNGQHTIGKVDYAVFSDAVEATVEVNILLPGMTSVYGMISATTVFEPINAVVLFMRGVPQDEKLDLVPSGPLQLGRSHIAVPFSGRYSRVWIDVHLKVAHPNEEGDVTLVDLVMLYLDKHTGEIRVDHVTDHAIRSSDGYLSRDRVIFGDMTVPGTFMQQGKVQLNFTAPGFHVSPLKPESREHMGFTSFSSREKAREMAGRHA